MYILVLFMSTVLNIEGKEYQTATIAGKRFGYTKDYLLLLIKNGKIDGKKIGNKWYVHEPSADLFFKQAARVREVRKKQISLLRKSELQKFENLQQKHVQRNHSALIETFGILIIGLSLGVTGYLGTTAPQQAALGTEAGFFESLALSVYRFFLGDEQNVLVGSENISLPPRAPHTALIVAPEESFSTSSLAAIENSFSDPVKVSLDPENKNTGIITPVFDNTEGDEYRFLMVPVTREQ
jgi:hypothetical protein